MTDQEIRDLAKATLTDLEFRVWHAKHYEGKGRRSGSLALEISEEKFRYHLAAGTRKLNAVLRTHKPAA